MRIAEEFTAGAASGLTACGLVVSDGHRGMSARYTYPGKFLSERQTPGYEEDLGEGKEPV